VETAADTLLATSWACSNYMYSGRCPDPYGIGKRYQAAIARQGGISVQKMFLVTSWIALSVGLGLMVIATFVRMRTRIRRREYDQETTAEEKSSSYTKRKKRRRLKKRIFVEHPQLSAKGASCLRWIGKRVKYVKFLLYFTRLKVQCFFIDQGFNVSATLKNDK
jgi:hypothetical protein